MFDPHVLLFAVPPIGMFIFMLVLAATRALSIGRAR